MNNYRSTGQIVDFVNTFVTLDPSYQGGRVQPPKPWRKTLRHQGMGGLGKFRATGNFRAQLRLDVHARSLQVFCWGETSR